MGVGGDFVADSGRMGGGGGGSEKYITLRCVLYYFIAILFTPLPPLVIFWRSFLMDPRDAIFPQTLASY